MDEMRTPPPVGLGTWKIDGELAPDLVRESLRLGYRHLDCASDYGNEPAVGAGLARAFDEGICSRDDVWVTSKLWNTYHDPEHVRAACERSLRDLRLDVLDLYLIHFPIALEFVPFETRYPPGWIHEPDAESPGMQLARVPISETWRAMEDLVDAGLVRHIGVCNFGTSLLRDLLSYARIRPAALQVELHPYLTQEKLVRYCREEGIAVTGFSPLGALSYVASGRAGERESVLEEEVVLAAARSHQRTPAQIVLRWGVQRGTSVVPKSSSPVRLRENLDLFDFRLEDDEMQAIGELNRNRRFNDPGVFCSDAFHTFCPIYE